MRPTRLPPLLVLLALALVAGGCAPSTNPLDPSADLVELAGLPPLGTPLDELDTSGTTARRDGDLTRYADASGVLSFAVCRDSGRLAEVAMGRRHPQARRFLSPEGITFAAPTERVRALLRARRNVSLSTRDAAGSVEMTGTYAEGLAFVYRFERDRIATVTERLACADVAEVASGG